MHHIHAVHAKEDLSLLEDSNVPGPSAQQNIEKDLCPQEKEKGITFLFRIYHMNIF